MFAGHRQGDNTSANDNALHDGIKNFVECRYDSASYAAWRLLEFGFVDRHLLVIRLDVHPEGDINMYLQEENEEPAAGSKRLGTKITE